MTPDLLEQEVHNPVSAGEEDARQFLREIRRYPMLTVQQERDLARRCAQGDQQAIVEICALWYRWHGNMQAGACLFWI